MENSVAFYPMANWATVVGNYTAQELREIADKIDDPKLRDVDTKEEEK